TCRSRRPWSCGEISASVSAPFVGPALLGSRTHRGRGDALRAPSAVRGVLDRLPEPVRVLQQLVEARPGEVGEGAALFAQGALDVDRLPQQWLEVELAAPLPGRVVEIRAPHGALEVDGEDLQGRRAHDEVVELGVAVGETRAVQPLELVEGVFQKAPQ